MRAGSITDDMKAPQFVSEGTSATDPTPSRPTAASTPAEHPEPSSPTQDAGYAAFISYSHAADGLLAPALQSALQSIGKPWYQHRAIRVCRDETSLAVSPELWPEIERALERSQYFVLLASPDAATSPWVDKEIAWWRAHRASDTLLIALTDGEMQWDQRAGDFSASSAVPPSARGWLVAQPLWVDLRWAHDEEHVSPRAPRFRDAAASLAAAIRGIDKDQLEGEDVRQHRRTVRLVRAGITILGVLAIAAIAGGILAESQRRVADTQRRQAQRQTKEATSLALTSAASPQLPNRPDIALLLALEAYRASPRAEARSNVLRALTDARDPGVRAILHGHTDGVQDVAFSSDGRTLASAGDSTIRLWDVRAHKPLGRLLMGDTVIGVAFGRDGRTLTSASIDGTLQLWDARSRKPLGKLLTGHSGFVTSVAFSPNGRTLACVGSNGTLQLWDVRTRKPLGRPMTGHIALFNSVAFSRDGRMLASAGYDRSVRLWDVRTRKPLGRPLTGHTAPVSSVAFSADGRTLADGSSDKTIRLWDVRTHKPLGRPLTGHTGSVTDVAFSRDGRMLADASPDKTIRVWDVRTHKPIGKPLIGHTGSVARVAFSPDGRMLASASSDKTIRLWTVRRREQLSTPLIGHTGSVTVVAFSRDGRMLASASFDKTIWLWDVRTHKQAGRPLHGGTSSVTAIALSADGRTLADASSDKTIRLWDVRTRKQLGKPLTGHTAVMFSPDGRTFASVTRKTIQLWDTYTRRPLSTLVTDHTGPVAFSGDGRTLASMSTSDATIRLWDVPTHTQLGAPFTIDVRTHKPSSPPSTSPTSLDDSIDLRSPLNRLALSGDGRTLVFVANGTTVHVWDVHTRRPLGTWQPLTGIRYVSSVALSHDGRTLASTFPFGTPTIRLWDVLTHKQLGAPLTGHSAIVNSVAFSPDGRTVASASSDKTIRLWTGLVWNTFAQLQSEVCKLVSSLSSAEWAQYADGIPYHQSCP